MSQLQPVKIGIGPYWFDAWIKPGIETKADNQLNVEVDITFKPSDAWLIERALHDWPPTKHGMKIEGRR